MSTIEELYVCCDCMILVANGPDGETPEQSMSLLSGHWYPITDEHDEWCPDDCEVQWHLESGRWWECPGCGDIPGAFADIYKIAKF